MKQIPEGQCAAVFAAVRRSPYRTVNARVQGPAQTTLERMEVDLESVADDFLVRNTFFRTGSAFRRDFAMQEDI